MHSEFRFKDVGRQHAILAAACRNNAVIAPIARTVIIAQLSKLSIPFLPVDGARLHFRIAASLANSFIVKENHLFFLVAVVSELNRRHGALIRDHAAFTKNDVPG